MTPDSAAPPPKQRKLLIDLCVLGALIALGAAGYRLAPLLAPRTDVTLPMSSCDLGKSPCTIVLPDGGKVEVAIDPRPIPALKPLKVLAIANSEGGREVRSVEIDFAGVDMKMGFNRPRLEHMGDGRFVGQANLPVCITGTMEWEATVIIETAGSLIAAPFRFKSEGS